MLEIRITISAPELARAINNLASAMNGTKVIEQVTEAVRASYIEEPVVPQYTREQIMRAGAALMDEGKINDLTKLLQSFGVQAVTQLQPDQIDKFAIALRDLGAKI
ncbi:MAG: hypothetical protein IJQ82_08405 [Selenomonadaceae bacterium]|nr:hypothetical protein [Selenomonadaceae bacterium]